MRIGILLFDEMELLDMAGPYEVFTTAARVQSRRQGRPDAHDGAPLFEVCTVSCGGQPVRARAGLRVLADHAIDRHPPLDLALVPGGVVDAELERPELLGWLASQAASVSVLASVCTGSLLLARAGVLRGLAATTHWEDLEALQAQDPSVQVQRGVRWVDQGRIVTSAGIAAGIDMSLHLVRRLHGSALAEATARQMDIDWRSTP